VCINRTPFAGVHRADYRKAVGQFKATYKKAEESIYKKNNKSLHSTIYEETNLPPSIIGVGDIKGTDDLLIFIDRGGWKEIEIHIYPGCKFTASLILRSIKIKNP
jgi:hypothetical protein